MIDGILIVLSILGVLYFATAFLALIPGHVVEIASTMSEGTEDERQELSMRARVLYYYTRPAIVLLALCLILVLGPVAGIIAGIRCVRGGIFRNPGTAR